MQKAYDVLGPSPNVLPPRKCSKKIIEYRKSIVLMSVMSIILTCRLLPYNINDAVHLLLCQSLLAVINNQLDFYCTFGPRTRIKFGMKILMNKDWT